MATFFLGCFIVGFALTAISFLMGFAGHGFGHGGDVGHGADIGHGADAGHGADGGGAGGDDGPRTLFDRSSGISKLNFGTVTAFLMWFGGIGFLLTAYSRLVAVATIGIAAVGGFTGAAIIFYFMAKILAPDAVPMDPVDYHLPGTLGRITVTIPANGTGEVVYTQGGTRKTVGARGAEGQEIAKGTEVVVMRYARGIAYVRPWDQMADVSPGGQPG
jgi:hypothetical protein